MNPDSLHLHEQAPSVYSISVEEFEKPPAKIEPYNPPDKVTRANFVNFLIRSFAISMGQQQIQTLFMGWIKLQNGFDFNSTFANFIIAGSYDALSSDEKNEFLKHFDKVSMHTHVFPQGNFDLQKIKDEVLHTAIISRNSLIGTTEDMGRWASAIKNLKTYPEFVAFARKEVESIRNRKESY